MATTAEPTDIPIGTGTDGGALQCTLDHHSQRATRDCASPTCAGPPGNADRPGVVPGAVRGDSGHEPHGDDASALPASPHVQPPRPANRGGRSTRLHDAAAVIDDFRRSVHGRTLSSVSDLVASTAGKLLEAMEAVFEFERAGEGAADQDGGDGAGGGAADPARAGSGEGSARGPTTRCARGRARFTKLLPGLRHARLRAMLMGWTSPGIVP